MPYGKLAEEKLASLIGDIGHPHRIRIIRELVRSEKDVSDIQASLGISQPAVSQHLGVLKNHNILSQRREGHHIYYSLRDSKVFDWIMQGLRFVESELLEAEKSLSSVARLQSSLSRSGRGMVKSRSR